MCHSTPEHSITQHLHRSEGDEILHERCCTTTVDLSCSDGNHVASGQCAAVHHDIICHNPFDDVQVHLMHSISQPTERCLPARKGAFLFLADMRIDAARVTASISLGTWHAERSVLQNTINFWHHAWAVRQLALLRDAVST